MAIQSESEWNFALFFFFFSCVGKWKSCEIGISCHSPAKYYSMGVESSHIFGRFQGVVEMCRFYPVSTVEYLNN